MTHEKKMTKCAEMKSKESAFLNVSNFDDLIYFASAFKNSDQDTRGNNSTRPVLNKISHASTILKIAARGKMFNI